METGRAFLLEQIKKYQPDLIIAGPAFNAGRFGIACGDVCKTAKEQAGVEAITGLYEENPAVDMFKKDVYILRVAKSAAGIRKAVPLMAGFARKLLTGEPIGTPEDEQYYAKGKRVNIFREKNGAERAVDMLLAKVKGEPYKTELEISTYEKVEPSAPIADLSKAKIALCTTGGMVPMGNPDHMVAATAKFWKEYPVEGDTLESGKWESVHAGFDPVYANNDPNRVAPYDMLKMLEKEGIIGSVYPALISTTGNSTSVADSTRMGQEIGGGFGVRRGQWRHSDQYLRYLYTLRCNDREAAGEGWYPRHSYLHSYPHFQDRRCGPYFRRSGYPLSHRRSQPAS